MCMTFTRKYETQAKLGGPAHKKARENRVLSVLSISVDNSENQQSE